jgi:hypothetical protein
VANHTQVLRGRLDVLRNSEKALAVKPSISVPAIVVPEEYNDDALALAFTERHKDSLRYTAPWKKWHEYDGNSRWREDTTLDVFEKAPRSLSRVCGRSRVTYRQASDLQRTHCRQHRKTCSLRSSARGAP